MQSLPNSLSAALVALLALGSTQPALAQDPAPAKGPGKRPMTWTGVLGEAEFAALHDLKEGAAPTLHGQDIEIGGTKAYLSRPAGGAALGGVVVIHEWWGLNDHVKHWTDRLAADGYDAVAVDLYGGKVATTREEALAAMRAVDEAAALATLRAAHAYLVDNKDIRAQRTASIGWCFGGAWSLRLAIAEPTLDAAVIYYGRLVEGADALRPIQARVLGVFGNQDGGIPPASVAAFAASMKEAERSLTLRQYDAQHAFANPSSAAYDAVNAGLAWHETRAFLARELSPPSASGSIAAGERELEMMAPKGWEHGGDKPMRLATFSVPGGAECSVSAFPGDVGGLVPNVNRWRQQMGAAPLTADEVADLPVSPVLGVLATIVRIEGPLPGPDGSPRPSMMLAAFAKLESETVTLKLTGPAAAVQAAEVDFAVLCRRLR